MPWLSLILFNLKISFIVGLENIYVKLEGYAMCAIICIVCLEYTFPKVDTSTESTFHLSRFCCSRFCVMNSNFDGFNYFIIIY